MKIMITGASGYIGNKLAHVLAEQGHQVHAFVRSDNADHLLQHERIRIFYGNMLQPSTIRQAMAGCQQVYHAAGLAKLWTKDPSDFYLHNVIGTENILAAALEMGVKKLVYTSTCGVWANSMLHPLTETDPRTNSYDNDYDLSKCLAEKSVREYCHKGLFTVIVNPPRVYGPGISTHSNAVNRFLSYLINSRIAFIPSANEVQANYAFIDDVVNGHLLAMEKGLGGERYILGGENASYRRLIQLVKASSQLKNVLLPLPNVLARLFSCIELIRAKISTHDPVIVPGVLRRLAISKTFDCNKAIRQLGYTITPLEKGIAITVDFLKNSYGNSH